MSDRVVDIDMFGWLKILLTTSCLLLGIGAFVAEFNPDSPLPAEQSLGDDTQLFDLDNFGNSDPDDSGAVHNALLVFADQANNQASSATATLSSPRTAPSHQQPPARASPIPVPA